ncbi:MAG TPA: hypothetical protein VMW08_00560 [Acidimicrobiales bacterium]|nr:hypothetical protein [Acidimicrobiales bacterium]
MTEAELVSVFPAGAHNNRRDIERAMQASHDALIAELGARRRSGVTWMVYERAQWAAPMRDLFADPDFDGLRTFLEGDDVVLVVAFAEADPEADDHQPKEQTDE